MSTTYIEIRELRERVAALEGRLTALEARPDASKVLADLALLLTYAPLIREHAASSARFSDIEKRLAEANHTPSTDRS